ncbi:MAG: hypothetical protein K6F00_03015 [Lachnospiraceae bacterium]|nr:hypothetical protein [Lachnospiraceae bacterium]
MKTEINFVELTVEKKNRFKSVPLFLAVIIIAVLFAKFAVYDRYQTLFDAQKELENIQVEIADANAALAASSEMSERYNHYTRSKMTDAEINSIARTDIMELIQFMERRSTLVKNASVSGNILSVSIEAGDLKTISNLSHDLEQQDIISSVSVSTAQSTSGGSSYSGDNIKVSASVTIYLKTKSELEEAK